MRKIAVNGQGTLGSAARPSCFSRGSAATWYEALKILMLQMNIEEYRPQNYKFWLSSGRRPSVHQKGAREQGAILSHNSLGVFCKSRWSLYPIFLSQLYLPIISNGMSKFVWDKNLSHFENGDIWIQHGFSFRHLFPKNFSSNLMKFSPNLMKFSVRVSFTILYYTFLPKISRRPSFLTQASKSSISLP